MARGAVLVALIVLAAVVRSQENELFQCPESKYSLFSHVLLLKFYFQFFFLRSIISEQMA